MLALKCKQHPKYRALAKPKTACFACWYLWKIRVLLKRSVYTDLQEVDVNKLVKAAKKEAAGKLEG